MALYFAEIGDAVAEGDILATLRRSFLEAGELGDSRRSSRGSETLSDRRDPPFGEFFDFQVFRAENGFVLRSFPQRLSFDFPIVSISS